MHCENCGCRMTGGLCPNCDEEAFIFENQINMEDVDEPRELSDEFAQEVSRQLKGRKRSYGR